MLYYFFSGIVTTTVPLDREQNSLHIIDVSARVKGAVGSETSLTQVVVTVTDVNDNTPSFAQKEYQVLISSVDVVSQGSQVLGFRGTSHPVIDW